MLYPCDRIRAPNRIASIARSCPTILRSGSNSLVVEKGNIALEQVQRSALACKGFTEAALVVFFEDIRIIHFLLQNILAIDVATTPKYRVH